VFASQRPAIIIVSDPGDQAVGRDYSFQEKEQTMHTTERIAGVRAKKMVKKTRTTYLKRRTILKERE
jgi:hypothetical protein